MAARIQYRSTTPAEIEADELAGGLEAIASHEASGWISAGDAQHLRNAAKWIRDKAGLKPVQQT